MNNFLSIPKIFLIFFIIILQSCSNEQELEVDINNNSCNLVYTIKSEDFLNISKGIDEKIDGIFLKVKNGDIFIQPIDINNRKFESIQEEFKLPVVNRVVKDNLGNVISDFNCVDIPARLDFVYFSWNEIKLISEYSKIVYISKFNFTYGETIFPKEVDKERTYYSYKLEGDFAEDLGDLTSPLPLPRYYMSTPCPPMWYEQ